MSTLDRQRARAQTERHRLLAQQGDVAPGPQPIEGIAPGVRKVAGSGVQFGQAPRMEVPGPGPNPEVDPVEVAATRRQTIVDLAAQIPMDDDRALMTAKALKDPSVEMSDTKRTVLAVALKTYLDKNPDALQRGTENIWKSKNIDTTPMPSSRLQAAQNNAAFQRTTSFAPGLTARTQIPQSLEELGPVPADSREAIIDKLEQEGVDTTSGLGGFWDKLGFAVRLNNSSAQAAAIMGVALDNIEAAGIKLPEGIPPISINKDLGQLEFLMPTEDGKLRRTLVEAETLGLSDVARLADLEELFAGIYAATATLRGGGTAGKHPFIRELVGDYAGRNVGIMLESAISGGMGEADLEDMVEAFRWQGNTSESLLNTGISRAIARTGRIVSGAKKGFGDRFASGSETAEVIDKNIEDAAQTLTDVNKLVEGADNVIPYTVEAGSLSQRSAQKINARSSTRTTSKADNVELMRRERVKTLNEANERVALRHAPADAPHYDPHDLTKEATARVNTARVGKVDAKRRGYGEPFVRVDEYSGAHVYGFKGDKPRTRGDAKGEGERLTDAPGIHVQFMDDEALITDAFAGTDFGGTQLLLFNRILDDAAERGLPVRFSADRSPSANKAVEGLRRRGFQIEEGADGVMTVVARPGEIVAPKMVADAKFEQDFVESTLDDIEDLLPVAQMRADDANVLLRDSIEWSEQRQTSGYYLMNNPRSGVQTTVRRIQNRIQNVLTGAEASEAERMLAAAVRREVDPETGEVLLAGLADETLDVGNLLNARAKLNEIAKETGDPEVATLVRQIDNLLNNQAYIHKGTGRARPQVTAGIKENIKRSRAMAEDLDEITSIVNASRLFKRNADGSLVNTDLNALGRVLGNGSAFMQHMAPVLRYGPDLAEGARGALADLYRKEVLDRASGWSATANKRFIDKYSRAIDAVYSPEERAMLESFRPPSRTELNRFERANKAAEERWKNIVSRYVDDPELVSFSNPRDIIQSVNTMGNAKAFRFMKDLQKADPQLHAAIQRESIEQTRHQLRTKFFNPDADTATLGSGVQLRRWYDERKGALKAMHGDQYVTDLETIVRAHELDARRLVLRGTTPPTQHDVIRVTRSLLGPLSKPQRQITAGNYINNKRLAAKVLDIYSDPAQLRALKQAKGIGARSEAGIAILTRLGVFEAMGIPMPEDPNNPSTWGLEFRQQVMEAYDYIDRIGEDENVEPQE